MAKYVIRRDFITTRMGFRIGPFWMAFRRKPNGLVSWAPLAVSRDWEKVRKEAWRLVVKSAQLKERYG